MDIGFGYLDRADFFRWPLLHISEEKSRAFQQ